MTRTNHITTKAELTLAEIANDLGPHLIDSTVKRSALERSLDAAHAGPQLRSALMEALRAAQIRVIEDLPDLGISADEGCAEQPDAMSATASSPLSEESGPERCVNLALRRLELDRGLRSARLPKIVLTAEEEVGLTFLIRPDGSELEGGAFARLTGQARDAADCLLLHNLGLAHSVAKAYIAQGLEYEDLVQSSMVGLIRAIEKFDPFAGYKFSTYATVWLRQSLSRAVDNEGRLIRVPVHMCELMRRVIATRNRLRESDAPSSVWHLARECSLSPEKVRECLRLAQGPVSIETPLDDGTATLGDVLATQNTSEHIELRGLFPDDVERLLEQLTAREADVVRMRYGLAPYDATCTLDEIGRAYGVSRERIRQIERDAMTGIREQLNSEGHLVEVDQKTARRRARSARREMLLAVAG